MSRLDRQCPAFGILYPGAMGAALGRLLASRGFPVVTTTEGRSRRTQQLCAEAGLRAVDTLEDVVRASDIVVSLVPPAAALEVAERSCAAAAGLAQRPVYVDANSISPYTAAAIEARMAACGVTFIDAAIHGLASRLAGHGSLYLSGPGAKELAAALDGVLHVVVLGDSPGQASTLKMLQAAFSKGLLGLFLEVGAAARMAGLLPELLAVCRRSYPDLADAVERMLPTVPQHARRRADEMREVERTMCWLDADAAIATEVRRLYERIGRAALPDCEVPAAEGESPVAGLMDLIVPRVFHGREWPTALAETTASS